MMQNETFSVIFKHCVTKRKVTLNTKMDTRKPTEIEDQSKQIDYFSYLQRPEFYNCSDNLYLSQYAYISTRPRILLYGSQVIFLLPNQQKSDFRRTISSVMPLPRNLSSPSLPKVHILLQTVELSQSASRQGQPGLKSSIWTV